jgi:hypothetical protein
MVAAGSELADMDGPAEKRNPGAWLLLGLLIGVLFAIQCVAVHDFFFSTFPGGIDFYSRWAGARALLLENRDPYSLEVTTEIQAVIGIDPSLVGKGGFAYPLYTIYTFWPLIYLSYDWAQTIWMVTLMWVVIAATIGLLKLTQWRPPLVELLGLLLGTLLFYPVARSIIVGQFTLHVTLFVVLALWALRSGRDGWVGVCLAATLIKPQMVILIVPWIALWAIGQRRWRVIVGLVVGGAILLLTSLVLFPRWPISFLEDVQRYSGVAGGRNPLRVLKELIWPAGPDAILYGLAAIPVCAMLGAWWQAWRSNDDSFFQATFWTIVVSQLIFFQTGTTNQVLLLIPLFIWIREARERWGLGLVWIGATGLLIALWILFVISLRWNREHPLMFLPVPLLTLTILALSEFSRWRSRRQAMITPEPSQTP